MNIYDELLLKLMLTLARDRRAMQGRVRSVGFMREYLILPADLGVHTLTQMNDEEVQQLAQSVSIKAKSDAAHFHFYLNDVRYRLVQAEQKKFIVADSLTTEQWLEIEKYAAVEASFLEQIKGTPSSIKFIEIANEQADPLLKLVHYVLFIGSDKGPAIHQAEGLFIFEQALNMNNWTIMTKEQAISYINEHGYIEVNTIDGEIKLSIIVTI